MAKFCGNCGKPLGENDKVCGNCGTHVAVNEAVPPTAQSRTASNAINGKKATVIGVALLAMIVLAVVLIKVASGTTTKPSTSSTSSAPSSSAAQQIVANSRTPDVEPTPIPVAKKETLEERAKKAIKELDVWDGSVAESFNGGDGSAENPYQIANGAQLAKLANDTNSGIDFCDKYFVLTEDILLNNPSQWTDDNGKTFFDCFEDPAFVIYPLVNCGLMNEWIPIGINYSFGGSFDGDGHAIFGLHNGSVYYNKTYSNTDGAVGLFGVLQEGTVRNTTIAYSLISAGASSVGTFVGESKAGVIDDCHAEKVVINANASRVGGICGLTGNWSSGGGIYNSSFTDSLIFYEKSQGEIGGILGGGEKEIQSCYTNCTIRAYLYELADYSEVTGNIVMCIGGICGNGENISNCYSNVDIAAIEQNITTNEPESIRYTEIGGIAGNCYKEINNCGSSGYIYFEGKSLNTYLSGISGVLGSKNNEVELSNCYANVEITAENSPSIIGGIVAGARGETSITNCLYNEMSAPTGVGTTIYYDADSNRNSVIFTDRLIGSDEDELRTENNYSGWDFTNMWIIDKQINNGFPIPRSLMRFAENRRQKETVNNKVANEYQNRISDFGEQTSNSSPLNSDTSSRANYPTATPNITESPIEDPNSTSEPIPTPKKTQNGKYSTVTDYLLDPDVAQNINDKLKSLNDDEMEASVSGETTKLIYTFQFKDTEYSEELEEALKESLNNDENVKTFCGIAKSLESVVDQKSVCVVVTYVDMNGKLIYSREFFSI